MVAGNEHATFSGPELRHVIAAAIYAIAAFAYGLPLTKVVGIFFVILFAILFHFGRRLFLRGAVLVVISTLLMWSGLLAEFQAWAAEMRSLLAPMYGNLCSRAS
jgi:hypothetical protein